MDFAYKANDKNVRLLRAHYAEGKYQGSGKGLFAVVAIGFLLLSGVVVWGGIELVSWLYHQAQHWF